ncbi:SusC/RagA family TonB-linked outer membrane protein [Pseudoflavitalea sp. X16]|uniref:SusC/RagA family TonB-linked outer membrane protein n=1 Tax=Paraflavitalea devenefica TaxID=2716334 RepID=UPI00141FC728|nr:SusC/RagA family TonB-linked outer membrane protein [Paraflavitalea devenefica]NII25845.1 SusC/RagA family TonB-linked outer membrane protein [Paraflavitalea devenefica]
MKLTIVLLVAGLVQANAFTGHSQQLTMDVKDESLVRVFAIIKKQTGYVYFGATEILAKARPVTIHVKNEPLIRVLDLCFKDQPLEYTINGKTIAVSEKKSGTSGGANGNGDMSPFALIDVRGLVTNEENDPVAGVSVQVKGTKMGTSTNGDGEFTLSKVPHDAVLVLTAVNIQSTEALVNGRRNLDLKVKGKTGKLDEVQIIAYGKTSQRFNVGNVTTVKARDIEKQPVTNPLLALQGRVPGLEVTQLSGMPGGGVTVRIQGRNSIESGLDPLIVIDGVPFPSQFISTGLEGIVQGGNPLNYVNPADIESIDVLKDADATAIYGSRAANGAILITTKKGKAGRTKLNINLQQGWGKVTRKLDMMNTRQYLDMRYEALRNDGINLNSQSNTNPRYYDLKFWDTTRYTDWQKTLIGGTAQYTNISAGISGGTTALQYLISGTYNRQTTVFPGNFDNKSGGLHFSFNGASPNQKFRFTLSGSYTYDQNHLVNVDLTNQLVLAPNAPPLYNTNGTLNWAPNAAGNSTWNNPLAYLNTKFNNTTKNLISNASLSYNILPGLEIRSYFGYSNQQSNLYSPNFLEAYRPEDRPFARRSSDFANRDMRTWIVEPQLRYTGRVGKGKIEGFLGATISHNAADLLSFNASGFSSDLLMKSPSAATSITIYNGSTLFTMSKYNALFGRLNYNWNDKYLINFTARRDGSSKFGDENRFHNFWSLGAGWVFSNEKFIKRNFSFLSFGKLRASYGATGNDQIADYSYLSLYYISNTAIPYTNTTGLTVGNIPNPHLKWEETRKLQGGVDLGLINDRIIINATYARNRSSNQLIAYTLPSTSGFTSVTKNLPATIQNTSWEFVLNTINVKGRNFYWSSSVNLTIPRNKLVNFPNIELTSYASGDYNVIVGQPLGVTKVFRYAGVDPATGKYLVLDKNDKPTSNPDFAADRTALITPLTKYYGGFQNSISHKGFQLNFLFQFVRQIALKDFYYFNGLNNPGFFSRFAGNHPVTILNHWQKPGDNATIGRYTVINFGVPMWPLSSDAGYSYEASYIRLKNLSLSWQLPSVWLQKAHLQNVRLYFSGQNLMTITKYSGLDPETRSSRTLPPLQLWTVGVQMEL